ncbi:hypothetical protein PHYBOEH_002235 [Phytophthora boehmeriae]|uniref:Tudor-knot domain-containing protein n=1 Tax=Phytophthora boehmeriae TaxID=109152 RepID=A0A8T1WXG4_9STRA|nr:hypothetical protein PHYBOEH_002235 [Phytophthora boehmeriae]
MAKAGSTSSTQCVGYLVDARDKKKLWAAAKIIQSNPKTHKVKVHFIGWSKNFDLWVDPNTMAPHGRHSSPTGKGTDAKSWDGDLTLFNDVLDTPSTPVSKTPAPKTPAAKTPTAKTTTPKITPKASPKAKTPAKKPRAVKQPARPTKQKETRSRKDVKQPVEEPSSDEEEEVPTITKRRKVSDNRTVNGSVILTQNSSVTDQVAAGWSDINATLARAKVTDREDSNRAHMETLQWDKERFAQTMALDERQVRLKEKKLLLEERRVAVMEQEALCRVQLLQAQAQKEAVQAQREQVLLKLDVATSRKRLRDGGVPEMEINELFPIYSS